MTKPTNINRFSFSVCTYDEKRFGGVPTEEACVTWIQYICIRKQAGMYTNSYQYLRVRKKYPVIL